MGDALSARGAVDLGDGLAATDVDRSVGGAVREVPDAKALDLFADLDATKATNALLVVSNERERAVPGIVLDVLLVRQAINAEVVCHGLERAVARANATRAGGIVLRKQQLDIGLSGSSNLRAVGVDNHTVKNVVVAGGDELLRPLDLNDAHAAAADFI